jgi:hypothetical protein
LLVSLALTPSTTTFWSRSAGISRIPTGSPELGALRSALSALALGRPDDA